MHKCSHCNSMMFGGIEEGALRFCNRKCYDKGFVVRAAQQIPPEIVGEHVNKIHQGNCPKCGGAGPVDVRTSYWIYSLIVFTRWSTDSQISCRSCGTGKQVGGLLFSFFLGWWGFPSGVVFTPIQIWKGLLALLRPPIAGQPSHELEQVVRLELATQAAKQNGLLKG